MNLKVTLLSLTILVPHILASSVSYYRFDTSSIISQMLEEKTSRNVLHHAECAIRCNEVKDKCHAFEIETNDKTMRCQLITVSGGEMRQKFILSNQPGKALYIPLKNLEKKDCALPGFTITKAPLTDRSTFGIKTSSACLAFCVKEVTGVVASVIDKTTNCHCKKDMKDLKKATEKTSVTTIVDCTKVDLTAILNT